MVDLVNFEKKGLNDVVSDHLESRVSEVVHHVLLPPGEEIVHHDHTVASVHQPVHQMGPHEPGPARHHDPEPLPLQPQRDFTPRIRHAMEPGHPVLLVRRRRGVRPPAQLLRDRVGFVPDPGTGGGGREEGEAGGGDANADEDEEEALLAEEVPDRAAHGQPRLWGFRRVRVRRRLALVVPSEN